MFFKFNRCGLFKYDFIDYHAVLCVPIDADVKEIRKRYLKIARRLHPDTCRDESDAQKELKNELLSKLVNPAYETLSGEKQRMEHILILSQMGKRLVQESASVELNSDVAQELASVAHYKHVYKSGLAKIAETQYDSLDKVQDTIALVSELNLVYTMRSAGKIFAAAPPLIAQPEISTNAPAVNQTRVISPPQKKDSVVLQYIRRAQDLISQNQLAQARVELQDALKLEPNNSRCHSLIGVVYLKQNLTTSAKVYFNRALELDPKDETALAGKLKVEQITGQKLNGAKRTASSNLGGGGLFGGLFGGKKK
ncbi:DnaJ domain-containing protein [Brasilonema sp. CT11]|nr:DnaJ domain-containing protein [Brasilonema sp. CT11]